MNSLKKGKEKNGASSAPDTPDSVRRSTRKKKPSKKLLPDDRKCPLVSASSITFMSESLSSHHNQLKRSIIESSACLVIGPCFIWLACNSLHITETPYIGGVTGIITALIFMEAALVPLLVLMAVDASRTKEDGIKMTTIADAAWDGELKVRRRPRRK